MANVSEVDKKVMSALAQSGEPLANKQIAGASGLDSKDISASIKTLKKEGLVESPARCKYALTPDGAAALKD
jgi:predicted transcriptional regulator